MFSLKANQGSLFDDVKALLEHLRLQTEPGCYRARRSCCQDDGGHGRIETRRSVPIEAAGLIDTEVGCARSLRLSANAQTRPRRRLNGVTTFVACRQMPNVLAHQQAKDSGVEEAVFVRDGTITEGTLTNVCAVFDGQLVMYPKSPYILAGVTREVVLEL